MKVHDDQSVIEKTGSTPLKYSPTVLVSTLLESWPTKHVAHDISARLSHWQVPTSATSNLAQSREADDSCMFPLSDPE